MAFEQCHAVVCRKKTRLSPKSSYLHTSHCCYKWNYFLQIVVASPIHHVRHSNKKTILLLLLLQQYHHQNPLHRQWLQSRKRIIVDIIGVGWWIIVQGTIIYVIWYHTYSVTMMLQVSFCRQCDPHFYIMIFWYLYINMQCNALSIRRSHWRMTLGN